MGDIRQNLIKLTRETNYDDFQNDWSNIKMESKQNPKFQFLPSRLNAICEKINNINDYYNIQPKIDLIVATIIQQYNQDLNDEQLSREQAGPPLARPKVSAQAPKEKKDKKHGKAA